MYNSHITSVNLSAGKQLRNRKLISRWEHCEMRCCIHAIEIPRRKHLLNSRNKFLDGLKLSKHLRRQSNALGYLPNTIELCGRYPQPVSYLGQWSGPVL